MLLTLLVLFPLGFNDFSISQNKGLMNINAERTIGTEIIFLMKRTYKSPTTSVTFRVLGISMNEMGWCQAGHMVVQKFTFCNYMDLSFGSMSPTPFGYHMESLKLNFRPLVLVIILRLLPIFV